MKAIIKLMNVHGHTVNTAEINCTEVFQSEQSLEKEDFHIVITPSSGMAERRLLQWCDDNDVVVKVYTNRGHKMPVYSLSHWEYYMHLQIVAAGMWTVPQLSLKRNV